MASSKNKKTHIYDRKNLITLNDFPDVKKAARLAFFTESNPRPVVEVNLNGKIIYMNPAADFIFPDLAKKNSGHKYLSDLKNIIKILLSNRQSHFIREININDRWFRHFFYYVPDFKSIIIYGNDITDEKKKGDEIKENEKRYHMLFNKMSYGYLLQDIIFDENKKPVDYRFLDANFAFEKMLNLKKSELLGKTINEITKLSPMTEEDALNRKKYDQVAITGKPVQFERYDQKLNRHFKIYAYKPNEMQICMIFFDTTKEKSQEEEKNNFISIMSHELRNPLTPILANAQFINSMIKNQIGADPIIKESISIIEKQSKVMADLLNDLMDISRLSRKKITLKKSKINVLESIKNSVKASMPFIAAKNQNLTVAFKKHSIYVFADQTRIEQIMVNLINNASKYTKHGGNIEVSCDAENKNAVITVKDNGVGMEPQKIKKIFRLFSETENQSFMGIGGMGIGLNIVKNLVLLHKGSIAAKSKGENKGSSFIIELPLIRDWKEKETIDKAPKESKKRQSRILVVEDNKDIRESISKILISQGHSIKAVYDGMSAVRLSKTFRPDTALIDIGLPDINGYEVAKMIREQKENKKIKLIAFTGYGQEKDKIKSRESGFDHHLTKPIDINNLIKLIS